MRMSSDLPARARSCDVLTFKAAILGRKQSQSEALLTSCIIYAEIQKFVKLLLAIASVTRIASSSVKKLELELANRTSYGPTQTGASGVT